MGMAVNSLGGTDRWINGDGCGRCQSCYHHGPLGNCPEIRQLHILEAAQQEMEQVRRRELFLAQSLAAQSRQLEQASQLLGNRGRLQAEIAMERLRESARAYGYYVPALAPLVDCCARSGRAECSE